MPRTPTPAHRGGFSPAPCAPQSLQECEFARERKKAALTEGGHRCCRSARRRERAREGGGREGGSRREDAAVARESEPAAVSHSWEVERRERPLPSRDFSFGSATRLGHSLLLRSVTPQPLPGSLSGFHPSRVQCSFGGGGGG